MPDSVRPIRADVSVSARKQQFLDHAASHYDRLAGEGHEPVCMVIGLVAEDGSAVSGYMTDDCVSDRNCLHIARAVMTINVDYADWDRKTMTYGA